MRRVYIGGRGTPEQIGSSRRRIHTVIKEKLSIWLERSVRAHDRGIQGNVCEDTDGRLLWQYSKEERRNRNNKQMRGQGL